MNRLQHASANGRAISLGLYCFAYLDTEWCKKAVPVPWF